MFKNSDFDKKMIPAKYINRFISLNSLEEFGKFGLFPNPKEVTESFGMYNAVMRYVVENTDISKGHNDANVFVVGDGVTPRTAGLMAFMTKWDCFSIDPELRDNDYSGIRRLLCYSCKIEDFTTDFLEGDDRPRIILMPHSHAEAQITWNKLANDKTWLITMPCCVRHQLNLPCIEYRDVAVASPKNFIKVYSNYKTPTLK